MNLTDKNVLVFGTGISGIGAAKLLLSAGADPVLYDSNPDRNKEEIRSKLPEGKNVRIVTGVLEQELIGQLDLAVISPGVPVDHPDVERMRSAGIRIWGEVELAWECSRGNVLAITGTNGKTTTTSLLGEIMKYHMLQKTPPYTGKVFVVGNIGTPYTGAALETDEQSVCVAEISSFQLETIEHFHPAVSAITNITPDHLDRHHTMEEYIRVKERICENQTAEEPIVLNYEDEILRSFGAGCQHRVIFFSSSRDLENGYCLRGDRIEYHEDGEAVSLLNVDELHLLGTHNYENVMTAIAMAHAYGVPFEEICEVCRNFRAVEHRIEFVAKKRGVVYYNDSKGTNPDAAIRAVRAMKCPTILIGGGYDKGSTYSEWIRSFEGKVRLLVLIGATKEKIAREARECGFDSIVMADTFEEAFEICVREAVSGDAVLLSPACASWDMFPNYEVRGKIFKEMVHALPEE